MFEEKYASVFEGDERWAALDAPTGDVYEWDDNSTYIREPPFFQDFPLEKPGVADIEDARCLLTLGDTVTTDHISPAGPFSREQPAGEWLVEQGVDFRLAHAFAVPLLTIKGFFILSFLLGRLHRHFF